MSEVREVDPIQGEIIHEYDGILEADNRLPRWWLMTLFATVVFAVGYWFYYEEFEAAPGLAQAYFATKAQEQEKSGADPSDAQLLAQVGTPAAEAGASAFAANCVACHGAKAEGKIGPNLTDGAWLHGGGPLEIYRSIRDGVAAKGMPSWGPVLGRATVTQLAGYVLSLRDSNVPGKAAEGTPYLPGAPASDAKNDAEPAKAPVAEAAAVPGAP